MFDTKAGAWLYKLFNGGNEILQDQSSQQYFVSRQIPDDNADDVATVSVRREFGWSDSQNWQYNTPVWGSAVRAQDALNDGNYFNYVGHMGMGVAEGLSLGMLTMGGVGVRGLQAGAGQVAGKTGTNLWPAASSGRTVINGIEYTTHALERMQPSGTIIKGTTSFSRGIPPSAVENAIKFGKVTPGNTAGEVIRNFENVE